MQHRGNSWQKSSKEQILLEICNERNDDRANEVRIRLMGATADLHAADAQYHRDCFAQFSSKRNVKAASRKHSHLDKDMNGEIKLAVLQVITKMKSDRGHIWSSIELYQSFLQFLAKEVLAISRKHLVQRILNEMGNEILVMKVAGFANLFCFKSHLPDNIKLVDYSEEGDDLELVCDKICEETNGIENVSDVYDLGKFRL